MVCFLPSPRVLSIQSHVVSGYCGNKSATFPLQLLGFDVDVLNTVQLSNHTQYKVAPGQIYTGKDLEKIHEGLKENDLLRLYDNIISGYVADVSYIEAMVKLIKDIKEERTKRDLACLYTFDPVLGDDGVGYYVPGAEAIAEAYKKHLLPLSDIIVPNRFEASILSGVDIETSTSDKAISQALKAIQELHKCGPRVVIITSLQSRDQEKQLICILSHVFSSPEEGESNELVSPSGQEGAVNTGQRQEAWLIRIPRLEAPFTGTGDLFAALITAQLQKTGNEIRDFAKSLENTVNSIQSILDETLQWMHFVGDGSVLSRELRLIQNAYQITNPINLLRAEKIDLARYDLNG